MAHKISGGMRMDGHGGVRKNCGCCKEGSASPSDHMVYFMPVPALPSQKRWTPLQSVVGFWCRQRATIWLAADGMQQDATVKGLRNLAVTEFQVLLRSASKPCLK